MRVLLDTHALLWWLHNDRRLSATARGVIAEAGCEPLLSVVSAWEIVIKYGTGQLQLAQPPWNYLPDHLKKSRIDTLDITMAHVLAVGLLPPHHKDPFDRLIVAQAIEEKVPVVTSDRQFAAYGVSTIW